MPKTPTIPPLDNLSLRELVELHNQHAPKPVRKFRDKSTAVARTMAVLPTPPSKPQSLPDRLLAIMQDHEPRHIEALALALDCTTNQVRGALGGLRHRGWVTFNAAPSVFKLGENQGERACAGPRYR